MNTTPVSGLQMSRDGFAFVDSTRRPVRSELSTTVPRRRIPLARGDIRVSVKILILFVLLVPAARALFVSLQGCSLL